MDEIQSYRGHSAVPSPLRARRGAAGRQPGRRQDDLELSPRPSGGASGSCSPSPCRWRSSAASTSCECRRSTSSRPRSRSIRRISTPCSRRMVSHAIGRRDAGSQERYVPNRAAQLKSSRLHEQVVRDPSIAAELSPVSRILPPNSSGPDVSCRSRGTATRSSSPSRAATREDQEAARNPAPRIPERGEGRERRSDRRHRGLRQAKPEEARGGAADLDDAIIEA